MRLIVLGAAGRMGRQLITAIDQAADLQLAGAIEYAGSEHLGRDSGELAGLGANGIAIDSAIEPRLEQADAIMDFTLPESSRHYSQIAAEHGVMHVVGTTGLSAEDKTVLAAAAEKTVLIQAGNMSLGVNLLMALVKQAASALDADFDIEVLEMHHRHKIDAPSGTALMLGEAAAAGRGIDLDGNMLTGREENRAARPEGGIGFATLRGGSVIGSHSVIIAANGERLEFNHIAEDRALFANGALKAARWGQGKAPGYYTMQDVLGLTA